MNRRTRKHANIREHELEHLLQLAAAFYGAQRLAAASAEVPPAHDQIAQRAYLLYLERGGIHGRDLDDWLRAEQELAGNRAAG